MKLIFSLLIVVLSFTFAVAQNDYTSLEGSVGYSHQRLGDSTSSFDSDAFSLNGFDASVTKNITRYVGIKGAFSGAFRNDDFELPSLTVVPPVPPIRFKISTTIYTYMGGVQIKDNSKDKKFKPFLHALAGGGTVRQKLSGTCPFDVQSLCAAESFTSTGFSAAFGGGIDIKLNKNVSVRAIQADYNPIFIDGTINNFRIGAGFVFH